MMGWDGKDETVIFLSDIRIGMGLAAGAWFFNCHHCI